MLPEVLTDPWYWNLFRALVEAIGLAAIVLGGYSLFLDEAQSAWRDRTRNRRLR